MQLRLLAPFRQRKVGVLDVPSHTEVGAIHLQRDAGVGDRLVLVTHGFCDGEKVGFLGGVVLVAEEQRYHARRCGRQKSIDASTPGLRCLEMRDIACRCRGIFDLDRRVAGRCLAPRSPGVAEHALGEPGKAGEVLVDEGVAFAAEAAQSILDVGGVTRLAHFAVVDDIDARIDLLADHLIHRGCDATFERLRVHRHALFLGEHRPDQVFRAGQAAGMGGQEPIGAALHENLRGVAIFCSRPRRRPPIVCNEEALPLNLRHSNDEGRAEFRNLMCNC